MRLVSHFRGALLGVLAAAGLTISGCGGGGGGGSVPDPTVRYFNGSPDSIALNFFLDDDIKASQIAYLGSTPNFVREEAATRDLRVQEDGTSIDLWAEVVTLAKDKHYLVSAIGLEDFGLETLKRLRLLFTEVDRTAPNGSRARLVIIHGYNRAPGLDTPPIDFQTPGNNPQFKASNIAYASSKVLDVDAGTWTFEARREGTESILVQNTVTLGGGKIYAAFVLGVEDTVDVRAPRIEFVELRSD